MTSITFSLLPQPVYGSVNEDEVVISSAHNSLPPSEVVARSVIPPYGQRKGWKPTTLEDFGASLFIFSKEDKCKPIVPGDGGSYPECHVAQYPMEMGKKKVRLRHEIVDSFFSH